MLNLWVIYEQLPPPFKRKKRKLRQTLEKHIYLIYRALNFRGALKNNISSFCVFKSTVLQVVIHHAQGLHIGIAGGAPHKAKAQFFEGLTHGVRIG